MNLNTDDRRVEPAIDFDRGKTSGKLEIAIYARCVRCHCAILPVHEVVDCMSDHIEFRQIPKATCPNCNIVVADWREINKLLQDAVARITPLIPAFELLAAKKPLLALFEIVPDGIGHGFHLPKEGELI